MPDLSQTPVVIKGRKKRKYHSMIINEEAKKEDRGEPESSWQLQRYYLLGEREAIIEKRCTCMYAPKTTSTSFVASNLWVDQ